MIIAISLVTPSGVLSLNDEPYRLAAGTLETVVVTHRRAEVSNAFLEGAYVVNSLRENVVVPVNVFVEAATQAELRVARDALTAAFDQVNFTTYATIDGDSEVWACQASDYTISAPRELMHSTRCRVDAQLVRLPSMGG